MLTKSLTFGVLMGIAGILAGVWMTSTLSIAAPLVEPKIDHAPQPIRDGAQDVARFFNSHEFSGGFKYLAGLRDETLARRYYRVKLDPDLIGELKGKLIANWTYGRFNRSVYQNGVSARLKKTPNMPRWWNYDSPPAGDHIMLDHGGKPQWYIVLASGGEVCLMWCGN